MRKLLCLTFALLLLLTACALEPDAPGAAQSDGGDAPVDGGNPIVTMQIEGGGVIKIELYPGKAPNTVANFVNLAQGGFYDGLIFHRTSPAFVIQGGCPQGTGTGNPGYAIAGEFSDNGFENDLAHERGIISMARNGHDNDSAGSQFFICVADCRSSLDGGYAAFGKVIEGMDVADEIASGPNTGGQEMRALEPRAMEKVTVETFGVSYKAETIGQ